MLSYFDYRQPLFRPSTQGLENSFISGNCDCSGRVDELNMTSNRSPLNATTLKIIAAALMFIDHIHQMWGHAGIPIWLNCLGRPVFPIFLFLMSESFHHTRSREKLLFRLLFASWFMTIMNLVLGVWILPNSNVSLMNNAFGTFFVAVLYMLCYDMVTSGIRDSVLKKTIIGTLLFFLPILTMLIPAIAYASAEATPRWLISLILLIPNVFLVEGGPIFVALGVSFYMLRHQRWAQVAVLAVISALFLIFNPSSIQWMMVFAAIPILLYNGEKGRGLKSFFYIFYPAHIYVLYIVASLVP